jgi:hypothetical protein
VVAGLKRLAADFRLHAPAGAPARQRRPPRVHHCDRLHGTVTIFYAFSGLDDFHDLSLCFKSLLFYGLILA